MLFITGITGLTGRFLLKELRLAGYTGPIRCLVRKSSDISWIKDSGVELYYGDVEGIDSVARGLQGVDSVIHLVNIRSSPVIIRACQESGVKRVIFINTTGIFSRYQKYSEDYKKLEAQILTSSLDYTIIRPTMIYGNHQDKNIHKLVKIIDKYPVVPVVGKGYGLMQPIYAEDLARIIAMAALNSVSIGKAYNVAGKTPVTFSDLMKLIASNIGKKRIFVNVPYPLALLAGYAGEVIPNGLINIEKVKRLQEDKVFLYDEAANDLGFFPRSIEEGIELEVNALRQAGIIS